MPGNTISLNLKMTKEMHDKLKKLGEKYNLSVSAIIRMAIIEYLKKEGMM